MCTSSIVTPLGSSSAHQFVYDPHFRPRLSAWREGIASRQRRRARPHLHSASSTSSDSEDGSQPPPQRGTLGKSNELRRPAEYSATSQIELRELIASEVESLRSNGEEVDRTSIRLRHKRNSHDRRVENVRFPVSDNVFALLTTGLPYFYQSHTLGPKSTSQPLISLDAPHISKGDPSTRTSELNRQPEGLIPSPLVPPPTSSHVQNFIQTVQQDEVRRFDGTPISPSLHRSFYIHRLRTFRRYQSQRCHQSLDPLIS